MYGLTRAVTTLVGAALAGILVWLASDAFDDGGIFEADQSGRYWATVGLLAAAGLAVALSQLFGGWTKWGTPRLSGVVFLVGFLPALIAGLWLLLYVDPGDYWLANKVRDWSNDLGIEDLVQDVGSLFPAVAFALGLLFGLTFDTSGPRVRRAEEEAAAPPAEDRVVERRDDEDETAVIRREDDEETVVERPPRT
jgi:MFS family permease